MHVVASLNQSVDASDHERACVYAYVRVRVRVCMASQAPHTREIVRSQRCKLVAGWTGGHHLRRRSRPKHSYVGRGRRAARNHDVETTQFGALHASAKRSDDDKHGHDARQPSSASIRSDDAE